MKQVMAHVEKDLIDTFGVVSGECAKQMAQNTREITQSDYCVSFTGNAGQIQWKINRQVVFLCYRIKRCSKSLSFPISRFRTK